MPARGRALRARGAERGSATIWILALATVLWTVAMGVMLVGQARAARHRAGAAADLAALAGASRVSDGMPCKPASLVARVNGGKLVACVVRGETVDVVVEVPLGRLGPLVGERGVRARARAGPTRGLRTVPPFSGQGR